MAADEPHLAKRGPTAGTPRAARTDPHEHIPRKQVLEIRNAYLFAELAGTPLNTFITIDFRGSRRWRQGDRSAGQIAAVKEQLRKAQDDWCRNQGFPLACIFVLENPPQGGHGPHIHILQHLPAERWRELRASLFRCLVEAGGWPDTSFAPGTDWKPVHIVEEELTLKRPLDVSIDPNLNPLTKLRYMAKGINPQEVVLVGGERATLAQLSERTSTVTDHGPTRGITLKPQGDVRVTKRAGSSRAIGKTTRKLAGWIEDDDLLWLCRPIELKRREAEVRKMLTAWDARAREAARCIPCGEAWTPTS